MDRDSLFTSLQSAFVSGAVLIVGSGVSASYGLPTMSQLAVALSDQMPFKLAAEGITASNWVAVKAALDAGKSLEEAMDLVENEDPIIPLIEAITAAEVSSKERAAADDLLLPSSARALPRLLSYFSRTSPEPTVITTNYDRLLEFSCDLSGVSVDSGFVGNALGRFDEIASQNEMLIPSRMRRGSVPATSHKPHIRLSKPHGSLDWYSVEDEARRSGLQIEAPRLMITPGQSKYLSAHKPPFDAHMQRAKEAIDRATSLIFVGYGFNDVHLQTHFPPRLRAGVPTVVLTRTLTNSARHYVEEHPHMLALEQSQTNVNDTVVHNKNQSTTFPNDSLWSLEQLMSEVLVS